MGEVNMPKLLVVALISLLVGCDTSESTWDKEGSEKTTLSQDIKEQVTVGINLKEFSHIEPINKIRLLINNGQLEQLEQLCDNEIHPFFIESISPQTCIDFFSAAKATSGKHVKILGSYYRGVLTIWTQAGKISGISVKVESEFELFGKSEEKFVFSRTADGSIKLADYAVTKDIPPTPFIDDPIDVNFDAAPYLDEFTRQYNLGNFEDLCAKLIHRQYLYGIERCPTTLKAIKEKTGNYTSYTINKNTFTYMLLKNAMHTSVSVSATLEAEKMSVNGSFMFTREDGQIKISDFP
jgi:hypothetical protein